MKAKRPVIAVFDIGKTNKKLLVFDTEYRLIQEEMVSFPEAADDEGFPCEDIDALEGWIFTQLQSLQRSEELSLKAINFSTYGASLVYINHAGERIAPLYNYLKPYPQDLMERFVQAYDTDGGLSVDTASPLMGHLNTGMQLYWLKHQHPALYEEVSSVLHFPQYLSYRLTGKITSEMTNVGCHSAMWHFSGKRYHDWLKKEGIDQKLLPVASGKQAYVIQKNGNRIVTGIGLHDSSAAVIPYLMSFSEPFVIVSTGTWTISLNPFNKALSDRQEISNGCLSYLTYEGDPVKVSMLFAGHDHDQQLKRIAEHFNLQTDYFKHLSYSRNWAEIINSTPEDDKFISLKKHIDSPTGSCVFHLRELDLFQTAEHAYHRLVLDIIERQAIATRVVMRARPVKKMYVDGGFSKNSIYMTMLSEAFADMEVYSSSMVQGTALGAALAIHSSWNEHPLPADLVTLKRWKT